MKTKVKHPLLSLVGAGPGDPELITVKALRTLETADVVLYDALVSSEILHFIPQGIPSFCVGKRAGEHSFSQEKINELIVEFAHHYGHVVRLKGGDPFVFGRGSEEMDYAEDHGIQTVVVPGISSALAVPASIGIPVTARGMSESVWIVTGTTRYGEISSDVKLAVQSTATIVILMGLQHLEEIMNEFIKIGKQEQPVAIVQNGSLPTQQHLVGNVSTIVQLVKDSTLASPAVIVVGEVVHFADKLQQVSKHFQCIA